MERGSYMYVWMDGWMDGWMDDLASVNKFLNYEV